MDRHGEMPSTATEYDAPRIAHRAAVSEALVAALGASDPVCAFFAGAPDGSGA